mmetsp:Transcript_15327/g.36385  ORF Transcript_15327/g.36385 Transcript_15327/m.36385 type:complete len:695 (-) Transcript_15327:430-2514(-)
MPALPRLRVDPHIPGFHRLVEVVLHLSVVVSIAIEDPLALDPLPLEGIVTDRNLERRDPVGPMRVSLRDHTRYRLDLLQVHLQPLVLVHDARVPARVVVKPSPCVPPSVTERAGPDGRCPVPGVARNHDDTALALGNHLGQAAACERGHFLVTERLVPDLDALHVSSRILVRKAAEENHVVRLELEAQARLGLACSARVPIERNAHFALVVARDSILVVVAGADPLLALEVRGLHAEELILDEQAVVGPVFRGHDGTRLRHLIKLDVDERAVCLRVLDAVVLVQLHALVLLEAVPSLGIELAHAPRSVQARAARARRKRVLEVILEQSVLALLLAHQDGGAHRCDTSIPRLRVDSDVLRVDRGREQGPQDRVLIRVAIKGAAAFNLLPLPSVFADLHVERGHPPRPVATALSCNTSHGHHLLQVELDPMPGVGADGMPAQRRVERALAVAITRLVTVDSSVEPHPRVRHNHHHSGCARVCRSSDELAPHCCGHVIIRLHLVPDPDAADKTRGILIVQIVEEGHVLCIQFQSLGKVTHSPLGAHPTVQVQFHVVIFITSHTKFVHPVVEDSCWANDLRILGRDLELVAVHKQTSTSPAIRCHKPVPKIGAVQACVDDDRVGVRGRDARARFQEEALSLVELVSRRVASLVLAIPPDCLQSGSFGVRVQRARERVVQSAVLARNLAEDNTRPDRRP